MHAITMALAAAAPTPSLRISAHRSLSPIGCCLLLLLLLRGGGGGGNTVELKKAFI
jgi:hypothetical protein